MLRIRVLAAVLGLAAMAGAQTPKKRVAVLNFDYATVKSGVAAIFGSNQDIGKGIADLLVDKLVAAGTYSVIERKAIDKILAEQNFANSDRADASTAARIGKVLGVDAIIIGSITQFGRDDQKTNVGGLGGSLGRLGVGGVSRSKSTAVVGITARIINAETAEILASTTGKGESTRTGTGLVGAGRGVANIGAGALDMRASNFADTVLGEATSQAVNSIAGQLSSRAGSLPTRVIAIDGLVADAGADGVLIINVGSKAGVKVGDRLIISRKIREVKDPSTGRVLRRVEDRIGEMLVSEVDEQSAVGKFTGSSQPKVGDTVKNQ